MRVGRGSHPTTSVLGSAYLGEAVRGDATNCTPTLMSETHVSVVWWLRHRRSGVAPKFFPPVPQRRDYGASSTPRRHGFNRAF